VAVPISRTDGATTGGAWGAAAADGGGAGRGGRLTGVGIAKAGGVYSAARPSVLAMSAVTNAETTTKPRIRRGLMIRKVTSE